MLQAGAIEPGAGQRQHVERQIEAQPALDVAANSSSMRPVPVPRSSSDRIGLSASAAADRLLDGGVGDVKFADAIPLGGMPAEIVLCRGGARGAHRGEPLAVAGDHRVVGIEPRDHRARDIGGAAALAQTEERPRAFAEALDQAGLGEKAQMARQAGLRLAQDLGEVGNRQLGLGDQRQDAQARGFPAALSMVVRAGKARGSVSMAGRFELDIKISLCD